MDDSDSATIPRPAKVSIQREVMARRVRAAAREPVWAVSRALLSPTAPFRTLPDYLLIGCQRCGTTSLQAALSQHPSVKSARLMKGVHYFDTAYDRDLNWYRSYFPTNAYRRRHDARAGRRLVVGECSPYYIFHPLALERIAKDLPDIKVVVLFRDPVERAISHHKHEVRRGNETLGLREALDAEPSRLAGEVEKIVAQAPHYNSYAHQTYSYVSRGHYAEQFRNLQRHLPADRVLVLSSEGFFSSPETTYERVLNFLGLPEWAPAGFPHENATRDASVPDDIRRRLVEEFAGSNVDLFDMVGERFDWQLP